MATETKAEKSGLESVKIDPAKVRSTEKKELPKKQYWIGTLQSCPYQNVSIAGMDFPRYIDPARENSAGELTRVEERGKVVWLDDEQVEAIKTKSLKKIIRKSGLRSVLRHSDDVTYSSEYGDQPIAKFVYMVRLSEALPHNWRGHDPEPMLS